jgi:hypothetical protein
VFVRFVEGIEAKGFPRDRKVFVTHSEETAESEHCISDAARIGVNYDVFDFS